MRAVRKLTVALTLSLLAVGLAMGQGFPGIGGGAGGDPATLIRNKSVQKELNLTDEQISKVPDAIWKALGDVLTPEQAKRLRQIQLQQRGIQAFADSKVQSDLSLTAEQKETVKATLEKLAEDTKGAFGGGKGGFGKGGFEKLNTLRTEAKEKIEGALTESQKKAWTEMVGAEFKMESGFGTFGKGKGGFGKKDGKGKKKKDID